MDDTNWPIVRIYPERVHDMPAFQALVDAWTVMLSRPGLFALISFGDHPADEGKDVTSARARFFKANRDVFCERFAVIAGVEPDPVLRAERDAEAEGARRGLGFNIKVAATEAEALAIARAALGHDEA